MSIDLKIDLLFFSQSKGGIQLKRVTHKKMDHLLCLRVNIGRTRDALYTRLVSINDMEITSKTKNESGKGRH